MIVDTHTHAFPDHVAEEAIPFLEEEGDIEAHLDGTLASLLASMDEAGVDVAVVASIATKPSQYESIFRWSAEIASDRIVPFPSVHPDDPEAPVRVGKIARAGFRGIKLHPYYQKFSLTEERMRPIFEAVERDGLVLLMHTGFDIAFPRDRIADPSQTVALLERYPDLKFIASHLGAWEDWDEVERLMLGRQVFLDTSYSVPYLGRERFRRFLESHPADYLLFGTDSPWGGLPEELATIRAFDLPPEREAKILGENAARLLGLDSPT